MEALKNLMHSRIRSQISNILMFGSLIGLTTAGLVAGTVGGVMLVGRTAVHEWAPLLRLLIIILSTVGGFATGVFASLFASPLVLRRAFFATRMGEWAGVSVYSARDSDLPGGKPNVFVSGFSFGFGPFRPTIFVAEGAIRVLPKAALEAVFAHELSHLECGHLGKRIRVGISTFIIASLLTAITLIGAHWSGYAEAGGAFSVVSGVLPAIFTWMAIRQLLGKQEFEADRNAIDRHGVTPESLVLALETLQRSIGGEPHPLVTARIRAARALFSTHEEAVRTAA